MSRPERRAPTTLRPMTFGDLPAVLKLERELFPEDAWTESMFHGELAQPDVRHYLVATRSTESAASAEAEEIVGYAGMAAADSHADVQTIGVRADLWGHGIGSGLLTTLLDEAARRGCAAVFLEVRADNPRARRLYERYRFTPVGVRKRYYQPSGVDAIVMCRRFVPEAPMADERARGDEPSAASESAADEH